MEEFPFDQTLSKYNSYILDKIIPRFEIKRDFSIYELVKESVCYKCILPSQNEIIMETYYAIKDFLLMNGFITEQKEMTSYFLTGKGIRLFGAGSIEKFDEQERKRNKQSILQMLLFRSNHKTKTANSI